MPGYSDEYFSCEWIEGGLAFNRRSLHACLIVHHKTGLPFYADYNGGPLPLERILQLRNSIKQANRSGDIHSECRGCAHLKKRQWPQSSHPINIIGIAQYSHCNIKCNYCFLQTQDPKSFESGFRPYPILETIRDLIEERILAPDAIIDWGGGEPTVYREFDDILMLTLERGAFHYVHSNGVRFPDVLRDSEHAHRVHIICSVDAGLPETYLKMKQRDYLEQVWANLAGYVSSGCKVTAKYIVREDNRSDADLDAFTARAVATGIKELIVDIDYDFPDPTPDVIAALARLKHRASRAGLHARYGFTGDNFATENRVMERVDAAFQSEQLRAIRALLGARDYCVAECADQTVEDVVNMLFQHCAEKDELIKSQDRWLVEQDQMLKQLSRRMR